MTLLNQQRTIFARQLQAHLRQHTDGLAGISPQLARAMTYSVGTGGKLVRALLVLAGCRINEGNTGQATLLGIAIEYIHAYSLIHDDLPAIDDDEVRRGQPSCHIAFGEDMAILTGDALQSLAFVTLADLCCPNRDKIAQLVAKAALHMVAGQALDVRIEQSASQARLETIHTNKTGELLCASLVGGALCGQADDALCIRLTGIGRALGLAFQIQDDLLECSQSSATLGKSNTADERNAQPTYPALLGVAASRRLVADYHDRANQAMANLPGAELLQEIGKFLLQRNH